MEIKNAIIKNVTLDIERGLSAWLYLDYGGCGQGFGGFILYLPEDFTHSRLSSGYAGHFIYRCIQIGGVSKWEDLKEKTIRVKSDHSKVHAIGHIVKEDWFNPSEDFKENYNESKTKS